MRAVLIALVLLALPGTASALDWTKFRDPSEGAFTLDVPQGWHVAGGLKRRSVNQPHPLIGVVSPDGLIKIVFGDPSAIAYGELTPTLASLGFRDGQSYTPKGEPEIIKNYRTGEQWSETLARNELAADKCTDVKVTSHRAIPFKRPGLPVPQGVERRDTAGETYLTCTLNGILYSAYGFSETSGDYYYQGSQILAGVWTDDTSVVLLAPQGMGTGAMAIADHMLKSLQWDQGWWQRQFHATVSQANAVYAQATQAIASQGQEWDQTIRGVEPYVNPQTGKTVEVQVNGASRYAQDATGNIIGLVGNANPPPGYVVMSKKPQ